jgi:hypothetical protein
MVKDIENFGSELEIPRLRKLEPFIEYKIELSEVRTAQSVAWNVAERTGLAQ